MSNVIPWTSQVDYPTLTLRFLKHILPPDEGEGGYFGSVKPKHGLWRDNYRPTIEELCKQGFEADRNEGQVYFAIGRYLSNESRDAENAAAFKTLRTEVDYGKEGHKSAAGYADEAEAIGALKAFYTAAELPAPIAVNSGGGLHIYWPLKECIDRETWTRYSEGLKAACKAHGFRAGHECTADAARVLRLPGTTNRKTPGKPRPVTLDPRFLNIGPYDLEQFNVLLQYEPAIGRTPTPAKALPPKPAYLNGGGRPEAFPERVSAPADANMVADQCAQVGHMRATRGVMPEPAWYAAIGVVALCEDGEAIAHEWSKGDERYSATETQRKIEQVKRLTGPTTCAHFQGLDDEAEKRCEACPLVGKIMSPLILGRSEEIEQETNEELSVAPAKGGPGNILWEKTEGGKIKAKSLANTILALGTLGITGRHNVYHNHMLVSGGGLPEYYGPKLNDPIVRAVRKKILGSRHHFDPSKENVQEALKELCEQNPFDPVADYLYGLKWDGAPRLDRWLIDYMGAENTELNQSFGRKILLAGVRRVRQPGCKFDYMLVTEGVQGTGKSSAWCALAGDENFSDQAIKWDDQRQQQELAAGAWIHESAELVGLRKSDVEAVKSFLSRRYDKARPAYGHFREDQPRRGIFVGTVNPVAGRAEYLTDPTGNRRFWPVKVKRIDLEALKRDRDQLWAEAAHYEAKGEPLAIPESLYGAATIEQDKRLIHEPWADILSDVKGSCELEGFERISTTGLLQGPPLMLMPERIGQREYLRAGVAMRALGWDGPKPVRLARVGWTEARPAFEGQIHICHQGV